jgi:hypothetical protein
MRGGQDTHLTVLLPEAGCLSSGNALQRPCVALQGAEWCPQA